MKVSILGSGSWGTALAQVLADNNIDVLIWGIQQKEVDDININHKNSKFFDVVINPLIKATTDLKQIKGSDIVLLAVPTGAVDETCKKLNEVLDSNPFSFIIKPYVSRVANNYIGKLDGLLKAIEDKDGKVDIEGILSESIDNLVVAQVKKYPNVFSGVEIGGGTIKINIPSFDKQLVFDYNDIESFKQNLLN